ncbi:MAG: hypothetical protein A3I07_01020 [Candidatus Doudnabacteria bacterium RIFCSPLOWO2_02_FULL_42_9]|uniref:Plasmid stabilization protein n=1 Tax=Candidatus Doudnabacteria bacterium RIFCSPHIGHO2_01_FULL_41_86 TaxID=1817821 RepID=A0A1F5N7N4_9BACT|nr:MAG: hypothetical protein A2717_00030 [Candidatus Doudnabacteria bacterium RIFCSPHIGHO2_01_FULL_41_86]OGE85609.1 MAG: hypothetical protein A3E28_04595 [Candidatus Doudnabacteria bacterium RIFCSPHIGHO2_12_FULL_42_22]OGE86546.1 MAG: hypothetical protein A3C49_00030 [Candidatus Doudnabacteria bacterium RIFCSPHIGHO2_02_FULL_42_25]OGE91963.1 MAG: hypothetical protein A2895_01175 [Candidatus Doudnabacteria bacterium RIFCSPLOWO2_01_FULL_42_60]OGE98145.1 MAG: hypothetical protein A3G89_02345 [Candid
MRIIYHRIFKKKFKKLPSGIQTAFAHRQALFKVNKMHPLLNNHDVSKVYTGCRSINITGDYRAIFQDEGEIVIFITIGTHSELYG